MWQQHPDVPWIHFAPCGCQNGGFFARDNRTGEQVKAQDMHGVHQFAADRSGGSGPNLGNAVHAVTQSLGIPRCSDCAQRQARMNNWFRRR